MNSEIQRRLSRRANADEESPEDVIRRLLEETTVEVSLEEVIKTAMEEYEDVASVYVTHQPSHEQPTQLRIIIFTGEAESFEEHVGVFDAKHRVAIPGDEEEIRTVPFEIIATFDGPKNWDTTEGTTLYMSEGVLGSEPLELDVGMRHLQWKLGNPDWERHPTLLGVEAILDRMN